MSFVHSTATGSNPGHAARSWWMLRDGPSPVMVLLAAAASTNTLGVDGSITMFVNHPVTLGSVATLPSSSLPGAFRFTTARYGCATPARRSPPQATYVDS